METQTPGGQPMGGGEFSPTPQPENNSGAAWIVGLVIILILVGLAFYAYQGSEPLEVPKENALETQGTSDAVEDIEADLESTNLDDLDTELDQLEGELDAALQETR